MQQAVILSWRTSGKFGAELLNPFSLPPSLLSRLSEACYYDLSYSSTMHFRLDTAVHDSAGFAASILTSSSSPLSTRCSHVAVSIHGRRREGREPRGDILKQYWLAGRTALLNAENEGAMDNCADALYCLT